MREDILNKIKEIISNSQIPNEGKESFLDVCANMSDEDLAALFQAVNSRPELIVIFYDNYVLKKETPVTDAKTWDQIIAEEDGFLSKLP